MIDTKTLPKKILIVDDHLMIAEGLELLVEQVWPGVLVRLTHTALQALSCADIFQPELILLDLGLPDKSGLTLIRDLLLRLPQAKIIVVSGYEHPEDVHIAFANGACAFVTKRQSSHSLAQLLRDAWLSEVPARSSLSGGPRVPRGKEELPLTERQLEVANLAVQGLTNKQIARELGISDQTVKLHLSAAMRALEVNSRTELAQSLLSWHY